MLAYEDKAMGGRVLLVEEDETTANALVPLLHKVGIEVEWVSDAASAAGRLEVPSGLDAVIVESAVAADRGLDLVERARAASLCTVLLLGEGEQAPAGASDVAISFPINAATLYAKLGDVADAAVSPAKILTPPASASETMPPPTWSIPEAGETSSPSRPSPPAHAAAPVVTPSGLSSSPSSVVDAATDPAFVAAAAARVVKGREALAGGRIELAIIELDSAAALHPSSAQAKGYGAWARFARVREVAKTVGAAHRNLVAAAERGQDAGLWVLAAEIALDLGLDEVAKKRAQKAIALDATNARAQEIVKTTTR